MSPAPIELALPQQTCTGSRFSSLRSVRWRIDLGILPSSPSASIEDLRRVAADSRRRYVSLRRRLLIDPHLPKDGSKSPGLAMDDPLSQNPDSIWGRFFRNAELEKMVDQDLSRLYPEHGSYFHSPACQAMLRKILLFWCLRHPEYGYRQGMHELLAPLLYVLHVDMQHLSQVQRLYEDHFNDEYDGMSFPESDLSNYRFTQARNWDSGTDIENNFQGNTAKVSSLDALDPDTRDIFFLSDPYGAEGELGVILSERFMEHDAYCMFDALMNGAHGVVAMAEFFSPSPPTGSSTSLPPVIEASSALYHLLSIVDSSLHSHLVELGVEPQYFALRWLRVLFGREFLLEDLLVIWDEIFSCPNEISLPAIENNAEFSFRILCSPRGAFISAMAVSMLLHLRSTLLATEIATSCLQRLLNFPDNANVKKLIEKAKSLQVLALNTNISSSSSQGGSNKNNQAFIRGHSLPSGPVSPKTPLYSLPESYWEEKWRVLHKEEEEHRKDNNSISHGMIKGSLDRVRFSLSRTESDPSPVKSVSGKKDARSSVRRRLFDDLSRENDSEADLGRSGFDGVTDHSATKEPLSVEVEVGKDFDKEATDQSIRGRNSGCMAEDACLSGENSSVFSTATSPHSEVNDHENDSEKSSVTSNSSVADNDDEINHMEESCSNNFDNQPAQDSEATSATAVEPGPGADGAEKQATGLKERKPLSGKFQWFWKFGRGTGEGNSEKGGIVEVQRSPSVGNTCKDISGPSTSDGCSGRSEVGDNKVMGTLRNLGQSMIENIQVIESVFQQDRGQVGSLENLSNNILGGKGQVAAMAALKELRKISNLLSEM